MQKRRILSFLCALSLSFTVAFPAVTLASDYILGTNTYGKPVLGKPEKGIYISDPNFHLNLTRISDKSIDGYSDTAMVVEYATVDIENCDGTKLILRGKGSRWYLYDAKTFKYLKELRVRTDGGSGWVQGEIEPRWSGADPNIFYYVMGVGQPANHMALYSYDIKTDQKKIVHDFSKEFPWGRSINTNTKGTPSADGRYWAFRVNGPNGNYDKALIVYDMVNDITVSQLDLRPYGNRFVRWISMSGSGKYVVAHYSEHPEGYGVWVYNRDLSPLAVPRMLGAAGHCDIVMDKNGHDGLLFQNISRDYIDWWDFETGISINLVKIPSPCCVGMHFSGNNYAKPGWGLVSTYNPKGVWMDVQHFMIELKQNPRIWRLAHHHSVGPDYWAQAFATINKAGTKIFWTSNWDIDGTLTEVYQANLPETWYQDIMGIQTSTDTIPPKPPMGVKIIK